MSLRFTFSLIAPLAEDALAALQSRPTQGATVPDRDIVTTEYWQETEYCVCMQYNYNTLVYVKVFLVFRFLMILLLSS